MRFSSVSGRNTLKMVTGRYRYNRIWKTRHCAEFRRQEQTHGGGGGEVVTKTRTIMKMFYRIIDKVHY